MWTHEGTPRPFRSGRFFVSGNSCHIGGGGCGMNTGMTDTATMLGYASGTELAFIAYLFIVTVVVLAVTDHRRRR